MVTGCAGTPRDDRPAAVPTTQPSLRELTEHPPTGELGLPLGTVVEIRATVIAGRELELKNYTFDYLLRVTEVNGRALPEQPLMRFTVPFLGAKLANDIFCLYELKTGKKYGSSDFEIESLERGYVGKRVRLVVYETGRYYGVPKNLFRDFRDVQTWQEPSFYFLNSLAVLKERP